MTAAPALEEVGRATPATPDLLCWLWAAVPPKNGRLHFARCAEVLGVHPSTVRRWVKTAHEREWNDTAMNVLRPRAFLRGRGHPLWPPMDPASVAREQRTRTQAERRADLIEAGDRSWNDPAALEPHTVAVMHHRHAHVYGVVTAGSSGEMITRATRRGSTVVATTTAEHKYAAVMAKARILDEMADARCIPPRGLLTIGRTETWHHRAGVPSLT